MSSVEVDVDVETRCDRCGHAPASVMAGMGPHCRREVAG